MKLSTSHRSTESVDLVELPNLLLVVYICTGTIKILQTEFSIFSKSGAMIFIKYFKKTFPGICILAVYGIIARATYDHKWSKLIFGIGH